jgi:hypothetical protein
MKNQKPIRFITRNFCSMLVVMLATATAFAVKLPNQPIPANGTWTSSVPFTVNATGTITVRVRLRVNTPFGIPVLGESEYEAVLVRMTAPTTALASVKRTVTASFETVTLTFNVSDCSKTGSYAVRLRNSGNINKQAGEAEFTPPTLPSSASGILSTFGVTQGNTPIIAIPEALEPQGTGGSLKVTATWDSTCLDTAGCRLKFAFIRNGAPYKTAVTGYAHNALFGTASPKMTLDRMIDPGDVNADWSLQITGDSRGNTSNVKATVVFTPRCQ